MSKSRDELMESLKKYDNKRLQHDVAKNIQPVYKISPKKTNEAIELEISIVKHSHETTDTANDNFKKEVMPKLEEMGAKITSSFFSVYKMTLPAEESKCNAILEMFSQDRLNRENYEKQSRSHISKAPSTVPKFPSNKPQNHEPKDPFLKTVFDKIKDDKYDKLGEGLAGSKKVPTSLQKLRDCFAQLKMGKIDESVAKGKVQEIIGSFGENPRRAPEVIKLYGELTALSAAEPRPGSSPKLKR